MFSLKEFLKKGLINAVGKMADYQIILNAAGWYDKGVLDDGDLVDIQVEIDKQYIAKERDTIGENAAEKVLPDAEADAALE